MTGRADAILEILAEGGALERRIMIVVAHPDDETIGVGAQLCRFPDTLLMQVTDGAPRDGRDAATHGYWTIADYAFARQVELRAALGAGRAGGVGTEFIGNPRSGGLSQSRNADPAHPSAAASGGKPTQSSRNLMKAGIPITTRLPCRAGRQPTDRVRGQIAPGTPGARLALTVMGLTMLPDRERCREVARRHFSLKRMIEGYLGYYRELAATAQSAAKARWYA
jgi:hypothetical protein